MANNANPAGAAGRRLGEQAVVIGGSIAGLVSARVLADHFGQVTLIERDPLPDNSDPRKGVPQGRHVHGLLAKGQEVMGRYFPGLFEELRQQGASPVDLAYDTGWYQGGQWRLRVPTGIMVSIQSRPLLEAAVRRRVAALPNVRIMAECDAQALQMNAARTAVTGVVVQRRGAGNGPTTLVADLVVDAGGRGSRVAQWLVEAGYPRVEETQVKINVGYTTQIFRRTAASCADMKAVVIIPTPPDTRSGVLLPIEGDRWIASLCGWLGDHAPSDDAGFLAYARSLAQPTIYNIIKDAEPLTSIVTHKIPSNLWRRYDRLARFPQRLVVLGDALCSFNPTYAQGMTTSSLYAAELDRLLGARAGSGGGLDGLADQFRKRAAKIVANPWLLATGEDLRYAGTEGARPPVLKVLHWYLSKVFAAEGHDPVVVKQFMRVLHMLQPPPTLFLPPISLRVLTARWRYKGPSSSERVRAPEEALPARQ